MRAKYVGPHADGVVTAWGVVSPGDVIEVPDGVELGGDFAVEAVKADKAKSKETN